jgi:hypothetical protein
MSLLLSFYQEFFLLLLMGIINPMPNQSNNQPAQNNITSLPLCHAKDPWLWLAILTIFTCFTICCAIGILFTGGAPSKMKIILVIIALVCSLGLCFGFYSFNLYPDRIEINNVFRFMRKTDTVLPLTLVQKVRFQGNTRVIIRINDKDESFDFKYGYKKVKEFVAHLERLGIKTEMEGFAHLPNF